MKAGLSLALLLILFVLPVLPVAASETRGSDEQPLIFATAQSSKQKQGNACRARYRDCVKLNQIPSSECQYIYQDCISHIY